MEEYCVDKEIAKELKENGFPQSTELYYYEGEDLPDIEMADYMCGHELQCSRCSAPTSDEILKELPANFISDNNHYWLYIIKDNENNYQVYYEKTLENGFDSKLKFRIINKKLSNCLALTWLCLKKEGCI